MEQISDNQQKYNNYREQMGRLTKAIKAEFYMEAVFIEYAIMEDRLESVLCHSGQWKPKPDQFFSLDSKRKKVAKMAENKKSCAAKYFPPELTNQIDRWRLKRNSLIHALLKQSIHTEEVRSIALEGQTIAKTLNSKVTSYNRMLKRKSENNNDDMGGKGE